MAQLIFVEALRRPAAHRAQVWCGKRCSTRLRSVRGWR